MFGTGDNQQSNDDPAMLDNVKQLASQPADQVVPGTPQVDDAAAATNASAPAAVAQPAEGFSSTPFLSTPAQTQDAGSSNSSENTTPAPTTSNPAAPAPVDMSPLQAATDSPSPQDQPASAAVGSVSAPAQDDAQATPSAAKPADQDHLAGLKQQALNHLETLSDHIEGTPEETFKTTMMMIQANDNHTLLEKALEAAKKIEDDKVRAQAMLDIINEINYFAQAKSVND
jgi:hypothetical protein